MTRNSRIYIAGHTGLVGSALLRKLQAEGYTNLITRRHSELDLERQADVEGFFDEENPEYVFLAAAKVGGIWANNTYPAEFVYKNLAIQTNVIHAAWKTGVKRFLFLGSSCIYPRGCPQPMKEEYLLTGPLESTNEPYAVAKICGVKMCESYKRQYCADFIVVIPTNLYGPHDNFNLETSHVLPALTRKFHLAKLAAHGNWEGIQQDESRYGKIPDQVLSRLVAISKFHGHDSLTPSFLNLSKACRPDVEPAVILWGSGRPRREFLHVDDLANGCLFLMTLEQDKLHSLFTASRSPLINIGWGKDISIIELATLIKDIVGFDDEITFDSSKPDGTPQKLLDVTRITNLGWRAEISLKDGIKQAYYWYLENARL
jgi:GDP-L-fucose synthase